MSSNIIGASKAAETAPRLKPPNELDDASDRKVIAFPRPNLRVLLALWIEDCVASGLAHRKLSSVEKISHDTSCLQDQ